ncbi:sulfatase-like hydrolase/transferase [Rosistilla oblonga]|uniref:sulfatase-like hydrolase/transferase n=1 Tax=Rosistilla oblonga TaxID=2527990 RepID=UPI003A96D5C3
MIRAIVMLVCAWAFIGSAFADRKPNVILIMADDVSWECFGCYGAKDYKTPNIDALAAKGMQFNNCYSTPICTPSRVKLMTGQYNFRNYTHFGYLNPRDKTFAQMLKHAGYKTAIAGKWQLNGLYHRAEGCTDAGRVHDAGFDEYCLWQVTKTVYDEGGGERFWSPPLEQNGRMLTKQDNDGLYGPDIMSDYLCDFIQRNRDDPFFVYYPTVLVHNPFVATPDTIGDGDRTHQANKAPKGKAAKKKNFVAMVNYLDKIVGKIVQRVEDIGQLENTLILFTADNGTNRRIASAWNGREVVGGKGTTTDMGTHVPLVAYWKGHTPVGAKRDDLIDFTDFYATFADAAGVVLGADDPVDGRSFLPQLQGRPGNPRDWVVCHYQPYWGKFEGRQFTRNGFFKLYRDGSFYRIPDDLDEANDLAVGDAGIAGESARRFLQQVMQTLPPAPPVQAGKAATTRPVHPDWPNITDPND